MYKYKLAKARKTRTSPSTLGLKKFGPGKLWVEKVWAQIFFSTIFSLNWTILRNFVFFFFTHTHTQPPPHFPDNFL